MADENTLILKTRRNHSLLANQNPQFSTNASEI